MNLSIHKQKGFTLLELVVVIALLGLVTSLVTDFTVLNSNQKRFDITKQRYDEIKYGIIGNTSHAINGQPIINGFYADVGRLPKTLSELIYQCRDSSNIGVPMNQITCEAASGHSWEIDWSGPYLRNLQSSGSDLVFLDSWGNSSVDGNFGWRFDDVTLPGSLLLQSLGLDGVSTGTADYEEDYPASSIYIVTQKNKDHIDYLEDLLVSPAPFCVNTLIQEVDSMYPTQITCEAEADHIWVVYP